MNEPYTSDSCKGAWVHDQYQGNGAITNDLIIFVDCGKETSKGHLVSAGSCSNTPGEGQPRHGTIKIAPKFFEKIFRPYAPGKRTEYDYARSILIHEVFHIIGYFWKFWEVPHSIPSKGLVSVENAPWFIDTPKAKAAAQAYFKCPSITYI